MKPQCIDTVNTILGREATSAELEAIEARLSRAMRQLAADDPSAWLAMPRAEQLRAGSERAARDLQDGASLKLRRQALQVQQMARLQQQRAEFPGTSIEFLARQIAFHADAQGSALSMESRGRAIENDALRQMIDTLEATNPRFFGLVENPRGVRDLIRELHGEQTGNADASAGAKTFRQVAETLRTRFNRAGGNIGKLEDWGLPHHHSQVRVARAGQAEWRAQQAGIARATSWLRDVPPPPEVARRFWINDVLPLLDRRRYLRDDGTRMDDAELTDFLAQVWSSIATGGVSDIDPAMSEGHGMRANRHSESRELHFKSADAFIEYQARYGEKSVYDVITGHIRNLAHDIAAVEQFGPNPDHAFRLLKDEAVQEMTLAGPAGAGGVRKKAIGLENLYNMAANRTLPIASERMARFFDHLRSTLVANRLGSAVITALTDEGTMMRAAAVNNLPQVRLWANELRALNPTNIDEARMANRAGLALNTLVASLNRFGNDALGSSWSSKMATATLRASGLNAMTDARRRAFGVTYMSAIGHLTRSGRPLADLDGGDHRILQSKGITHADFEVWRRAELEDWGAGNDTMLTADAIYRVPDTALADLGEPRRLREEAATKLLGAVLEETDMAVIEPGVRERTIMRANLQRGTLTGELVRSAWLFKSFPLAMITRHWERALSEPTGGARVRALAALTTSTTVLGMVALQVNALKDGKDPYDMTDRRTLVAALLKGGALSIFGDFLFSERTESGRGVVATALGPVFSLAEEALALTWGNALQASKGEETDAGAEAVRFAKSNTPGVSAAMNLWYTRAAVDHMLVHDLQELLSPGYLDRMRARAEREFDASYYWEPGGSPLFDSEETWGPERSPNFEKAVGAEQ